MNYEYTRLRSVNNVRRKRSYSNDIRMDSFLWVEACKIWIAGFYSGLPIEDCEKYSTAYLEKDRSGSKI